MILMTIPLTLFVPVLPWIALLAWDLGRSYTQAKLLILVLAGLLLDLWWGKPLGSCGVLFTGLALSTRLGQNFWPADPRIWVAISLVGTFLATEVFLRL